MRPGASRLVLVALLAGRPICAHAADLPGHMGDGSCRNRGDGQTEYVEHGRALCDSTADTCPCSAHFGRSWQMPRADAFGTDTHVYTGPVRKE